MNAQMNFLLIDLMRGETDFVPEIVSVAHKVLDKHQLVFLAFYLIKHDKVGLLPEVLDRLDDLAVDDACLYALFYGLTGEPRCGCDALYSLHGKASNEIKTYVYEALLLIADRRYQSAAKRLAYALALRPDDHRENRPLDVIFSVPPERRKTNESVRRVAGDFAAIALF